MTTIEKLRQFCRAREGVPSGKEWMCEPFAVNNRACATNGQIIVSAPVDPETKNEAPASLHGMITGWITPPDPKHYPPVRVEELPRRAVKWRCMSCNPKWGAIYENCPDCLNTQWDIGCDYRLSDTCFVAVRYVAKLLNIFGPVDFYPTFGRETEAVPFTAGDGITGSLMPVQNNSGLAVNDP